MITYSSNSLSVIFLSDDKCSQEKTNLPLIIGLSVGLSLFVLAIGLVTFAIKPLREVVMPFYRKNRRKVPQDRKTHFNTYLNAREVL